MSGIHFNGMNIKQQPIEQRPKEEIKQISAKLHQEYDQDLKEAIKKIPKRERSKIYRDALRYFLRASGVMK